MAAAASAHGAAKRPTRGGRKWVHLFPRIVFLFIYSLLYRRVSAAVVVVVFAAVGIDVVFFIEVSKEGCNSRVRKKGSRLPRSRLESKLDVVLEGVVLACLVFFRPRYSAWTAVSADVPNRFPTWLKEPTVIRRRDALRTRALGFERDKLLDPSLIFVILFCFVLLP